ncbi:cytidine deaminase [Granulicella tundricola]|uniref:Cytidine deaminase n=1 Tax=Granulicella tundricola (strain ATCC BAA-1859 / DSM 23138 / MP5ACTX9) TaxID=1198114 RepID=E8X301_GRATM|nr:cytidine deaminase [Granulicella tundricola]ADW68135.1 cytidine deaminase [Granulicella tundricola MP5ACTX9]
MTPTELAPTQLAELTRHAEAVASNAYAPYSNFQVGAALLLESGEIVTGCNVENASYRLTSCAEQAAIAAAVATHGPAIRIRAVVVVNLNGAACSPCGACRQTLAEFAAPGTTIVFPTETGTTTCTMADLLPNAFTQSSLI